MVPEINAQLSFKDPETILDVLWRGCEGRLETNVLLELSRVADDAVAVDLPLRIDPAEVGAGVGGVLAARVFPDESLIPDLGFCEFVKAVIDLRDKELPILDPLGLRIELQICPHLLLALGQLSRLIETGGQFGVGPFKIL